MLELEITNDKQFEINRKNIEMENEIYSYFDNNIKKIDESFKQDEEF